MLGEWCEIVDLENHPSFPAIPEHGTSFTENAAIKAKAASLHFPGMVLSDDSGLEVDALNGAPGVYSARYAGPNATDAENRARLLREMATLPPTEPRTARFRCVLAFAENGMVLASFDGSVEGRIIHAERGTDGFGYDSLFVPAGFDLTFAELGVQVKNSLSHRGRAVVRALEWLRGRAQ